LSPIIILKIEFSKKKWYCNKILNLSSAKAPGRRQLLGTVRKLQHISYLAHRQLICFAMSGKSI